MKGKEPGREKVCMALGPQNQKTVRLEKKKQTLQPSKPNYLRYIYHFPSTYSPFLESLSYPLPLKGSPTYPRLPSLTKTDQTQLSQ